jgi:hypothetical protein
LRLDQLPEVRDADPVLVGGAEGGGDGDEAAEDGEHLVVGRVLGDEVGGVDLADDGGDAGEARPAAGHYANVSVAIPAALVLAVGRVVVRRHGFAEFLDAWSPFGGAGCGKFRTDP